MSSAKPHPPINDNAADRARERELDQAADAGAGADVAEGEDKAPSAYRTISEVSILLDVPQHVLRFWETKFAPLRPMKRGGGRRYYRPEDVTLLTKIKGWLYDEGLTIKGAQKRLKGRGIRQALAEDMPKPIPLSEPARRELGALLTELKALRAELD